jgi:hypothetical protein
MAVQPNPASFAVMFDWLRLVCRSDGGAAVRNLASQLGPLGSDSPFLALAAWHGVLGLVLSRFEREGMLGSLEAGAPGGLSNRLRVMRVQAAILSLECERVLEVLARARVGCLLLKGAALRRTVYRRPVERPMGDLDLLVEPSRVDGAIETLIDAGYARPPENLTDAYRRHHFHVVLRHPSGFLVEVHWALSRSDAPFRLDQAEFHRDSVPVENRNQVRCRIPSPEHMVLHMASQNVEDGFSRLRRLVDLDRLLCAYPGLDWDRVLGSARTGGLRHVLAHSLRFTHRLLGTPLPEVVAARLRPPLPTRAHLALLGPERMMVPQGAARRASADRLLYLWLIDGSRRRLGEVAAIIRGRSDPMDWVWLHQPEPGKGTQKTGPLLFLKLLAYQVWLYLAAPVSLRRRLSRPRK